MKIYKAAIIGLGPSGLAVNKLIFDNKSDEVIAFDNSNFEVRDNFFGFWLSDWMKPFETLIEKKWNKWIISDEKDKIIHVDNKKPYCVIRYQTWKNFCLNTNNNLNIINKKVISYSRTNNFFRILTEDKKEYFAKKIYDSRNVKQKENKLLQHFFGINITTDDYTFDQNKLTLMHFTKESNVLHFIYVLPTKHNEALIESTVFSNKTFDDNWYKNQIYNYAQDKSIRIINQKNYERGIIPMFDSKEEDNNDKDIFNIGIRGGACKISTGYSFAFMIKQILSIKKSRKNKNKIHNYIDFKMDELFVNFLNKNKNNSIHFINIAKKLNGNEFQSFMMGESSILTKLKIINCLPKIKFIKTIFF